MSLTRAIAWNTAIQVAGRVLGLLVSVLLTAILTRHLGLATYGQLVAASTYVGLFTVLGDAGVYLVAVRRAAQATGDRAEILGNALGLRLVLALVPLAIGILLVLLVPSDRFPTYVPAVKLAVAILALNGYVTLLNQFMIAVFRLHLRMDLAVLGEMLSRLVTLLGTLLVVALDGGLLAASAAIVAGSVANLTYAWWCGRRFESFQPRLDWPMSRSMLQESAVLTVVTLLSLIHFKVDTLMLSVLRSPADVGVYGVAYKAHEVLITFPGLFVGLLYPLFARFSREDPVRLQAVFRRALDVLLATAMGAALLVYVLSPDLAPLLGADAAVRPMRILAFALPPVFMGLGFTHLLLAEARQKWLVPLYALLVAVNVSANWVAIRRWSYLGAAGVTVGTESLSLLCLLVYWVGRRRWRLLSRGALAVPLALALGAAGSLVLAPSAAGEEPGLMIRVLRLVAGAGVLSTVYAAGIFGLRILPLSAIRELWPRNRAAGPEADASAGGGTS